MIIKESAPHCSWRATESKKHINCILSLTVLCMLQDNNSETTYRKTILYTRSEQEEYHCLSFSILIVIWAGYPYFCFTDSFHHKTLSLQTLFHFTSKFSLNFVILPSNTRYYRPKYRNIFFYIFSIILFWTRRFPRERLFRFKVKP